MAVGRGGFQPTIALSATEKVAAGDTVTVTGGGFSAGEQVTVAVGGGAGRTVTVAASAKGAVRATVATPGDAPPGRYAVIATGASSRTPATATVQVTGRPDAPAYQPRVSLPSTAGARGTSITVDGSGFAPNEAVAVSFGDGRAVGTVRANGDGVLAGVTVSVPGAARAGSTSITLVGATSATRVAVPFTVTG